MNTYFLSNNFLKCVKNNLYIDYFVKKITEIFLKNYLVLTPMFFGEKYLIEIFTKKFTNTLLFNFFNIFKYKNYSNSYFFSNILTLFFYFLFICNLFYLF